jgi:cytoskeleton protein RodZ
MDTLGIWLRRTREAQNLTPEQIEAATRIKPRALEILEAGNFSALPGGDMQARGFLRIYARHLGLSADEAIARYEAEVHGIRYVPPVRKPASSVPASPQRAAQARLSPAPLATPTSASSNGMRRRWGTIETMLVGGMALAVLVAVLAGVTYLISRNASATEVPSATDVPTLSPEAIVAAATEAEPAVLATPADPAPTRSQEFTVGSENGITVTLRATEHVWVQVTSDEAIVFRGVLAPEQDATWSAVQRISVETGNGGGLQATVNGQLLGALGQRGQVARRAWGLDGEVEVTPVGS